MEYEESQEEKTVSLGRKAPQFDLVNLNLSTIPQVVKTTKEKEESSY